VSRIETAVSYQAVCCCGLHGSMEAKRSSLAVIVQEEDASVGLLCTSEHDGFRLYSAKRVEASNGFPIVERCED
jgi:hypothetical protein